MTSASESLATVMPEAPAPNCSLAILGILCVFTWGLSATPFSLATWAIFCMFLSIFGPSTKRYGVPEECVLWYWEFRIVRLLGTIYNFETHISQFNASIFRLFPASAYYEGRLLSCWLEHYPSFRNGLDLSSAVAPTLGEKAS